MRKEMLYSYAASEGIPLAEVDEALARGVPPEAVLDAMHQLIAHRELRRVRRSNLTPETIAASDSEHRNGGRHYGSGHPAGQATPKGVVQADRRQQDDSRVPVSYDVPHFFRTRSTLYLVLKTGAETRVFRIPRRLSPNVVGATWMGGRLRSASSGLRVDRCDLHRNGALIAYTTKNVAPRGQKTHLVETPKPLGTIVSHWRMGEPEPPDPTNAASGVNAPRQVTGLSWEVLPAGAIPRFIGRELRESGDPSKTDAVERLDFLDSLSPRSWYVGTHLGERLYYVADFGNVAIAECTDFGNALYFVLSQRGDWRTILRATKREARAAGAARIVHSGDWRSHVRRIVQRSTPPD